jgi:hypothetical protein
MTTLTRTLPLVAFAFLFSVQSFGQLSKIDQEEERLSPMGRIARDHALGKRRGPHGQFAGDEPHLDGPSETQSEVSVAVDSTGMHVVIGYNDFRGFSAPTLSLSGFSYSDDGGATFVDGGQLPTPGSDVLFGQRFPQVFGDPDVKYLGGCTFIYSSLALEKFGSAGIVQTVMIHRSTDCGHTWTGPFEVTPSINPNGLVDVNGDAEDAADKELMDVDPDTGRLMICWSNFTPLAPGGVDLSCTYSDNAATGTPTFAPRRVVAATVADGQAMNVRFAGNGSANAYVAWSRFTSYYTNNIGFARSTDNGVTWSAPVNLTSNFVTMDQVLGDDRVNNNPWVAVDNSSGPFQGRVYVVYSRNNMLDGADIVFQRSSDGGITFSTPITLNSRPGNDRAQWFPLVAVDKTTGRVNVFYNDQGVASSGDLTEVTLTTSDDGGTTWSRPMPITDRPFKAGWGIGNSTPNLGDYIGGTAQLGVLYVGYAITSPVGFTDGQPSASMTVPDVAFSRIPASTQKVSLRLGAVTFTESGGNGTIDPGDSVNLTIPVTNYVTNALNAATITGVAANLTTTTPGVTISAFSSFYPNVSAGATSNNTSNYVLQLLTTFVAGTTIEFALSVSTAQGATTLLFRLPTGTPSTTSLLSENFDGVTPGALPTGWTAVHGAGANAVPWRTSNTFCGTSNAAFHANANDGPTGGSPSRWERLFSPIVTVPANSQYVTLEFDVCYDTEDDPNFRYLAYDGFLLRITDQTAGATLRSVFAEAFEEEFTTGTFEHYPKHLPRSNDVNYFADISAWGGFSSGVQHVRMKLPGMAGRRAQLRFEYTQDSSFICSNVRPGHTCGVIIDNIVMKSVVSLLFQSINFAALSNQTFGNSPFTISATATSGSPVTFSASGNCTVSGNTVTVGTVGSCTITASQAGNSVYLPADPVSRSFNILPLSVAANISFTPANTQYSDPATINATLPVLFGLNPAASVSFQLAGQTLAPVPFSSAGGILTASATGAPLLVSPGGYTVVVNYGDVNPNFTVGPPNVSLVVSREDARATYTGPTFVSTSSVTSSTATVALSATIQDITAVPGASEFDSTAGDIRNATARFVNRDAGNAELCTAPIGLISSADLKTGTLSCIWNADIGKGGSNSYHVGIIVDGYYTRNSSADDALVTISRADGELVSGGGSIVLTASAGRKAGDPGSTANFAFNSKFNQNGRNLQGSFSGIFRRTESGVVHVFQIKANSFNSLAGDPTTGKVSFGANVSLEDATDPGRPRLIDGNAALQVTMTDRGEPGKLDSIAITVLDNNGGLWFASDWNGTAPVEDTLATGNLQVK